MVCERETIERLDPYEKDIAERFMQNNLRRVGEENKPVNIGSLDLMRGFKVEDLTGQEWVVRIIGKKRDVLVRRMNIFNKAGEREYIYHLWNPGKMVRVPKEKICEK